MIRSLSIYILIIIILSSCSKENVTIKNDRNTTNPGWIVNTEFLRLSPDSKDLIKSIDHPQFEPTYNVILDQNEIVYIFRHMNAIRIYPQIILDKHEFVNDNIGDHYFCITYCPLTGTALAWNRELGGNIVDFGVSGNLLNNNLIAYDRHDTGYWSQMYALNVNGIYSGDRLRTMPLIRSNWLLARSSFPDALVLLPDSSNVCNDSICNVPEEYKQSDDKISFGIIEQGIDHSYDQALLIQTDKLINTVNIIDFKQSKKQGFVIYSSKNELFAAYYYSYTGQIIRIDNNKLPILLNDNNGTVYDITGLAISGADEGKRLESPLAYGAKMFAWEGFFGENISYIK